MAASAATAPVRAAACRVWPSRPLTAALTVIKRARARAPPPGALQVAASRQGGGSLKPVTAAT